MTVNIFGNILQLFKYMLTNIFSNDVFCIFIYILIINVIIWTLRKVLFLA